MHGSANSEATEDGRPRLTRLLLFRPNLLQLQLLLVANRMHAQSGDSSVDISRRSHTPTATVTRTHTGPNWLTGTPTHICNSVKIQQYPLAQFLVARTDWLFLIIFLSAFKKKMQIQMYMSVDIWSLVKLLYAFNILIIHGQR